MMNYPHQTGWAHPYGSTSTPGMNMGMGAGMPHPQAGIGGMPQIPAGSVITGPTTAIPAPSMPSTGINPPGILPIEQSFIENILRLNLNKIGTFYMTYENNSQWNAKVFKGRIEAAGRDHIIISDPQTGMRFLLLMVNLDYVTFDEPLNYQSPFQTGQGTPGIPTPGR